MFFFSGNLSLDILVPGIELPLVLSYLEFFFFSFWWGYDFFFLIPFPHPFFIFFSPSLFHIFKKSSFVFFLASLLKILKHANIVTLHDIIRTDETLTFVFEYVVSIF